MEKFIFILTFVLGFEFLNGAEEVKGGDFCMTEKLEANCAQDEVIVMQAARYGRMKLGRCVKTDFGFVGCSSDVLDLADKRCSGRQTCVINVPDPLFENTKPCNEEFKFYLEATYVCRKVSMAQPGLCKAYSHMKLPLNGMGYLANIVTQTTGCGGEDEPWRIEVQAGQNINLTLVDFSAGQESTVARFSTTCLIYAKVTESGSSEKENICGGTGQREKHVYTSTSSTIDIAIRRSYQQDLNNHFLIKYEAIGCPNPPKPKGGWMTREGTKARMGCDGSDAKWTMVCDGTSWSGEAQKCTPGGDDASDGSAFYEILNLPLGLSVTVIIAIAVGVSVVILCIGLCIIRSRRIALTRQQREMIESARQYPQYPEKYPMPCEYEPNAATPGRGYAGERCPYTENEYAYVWENNTPPPGSTRGKSRMVPGGQIPEGAMPGGAGMVAVPPGKNAQEVATYEPTKVRRQPGPVEHQVPQYYDVDPELAFKMSATKPGHQSSESVLSNR